jgi:hypothetical protein
LINSVVLHRHGEALERKPDGLLVADAKVVGRNSEGGSKGFGASDTVLGIEKHELRVLNAAHGIQYVTLKFISLRFVKQATATGAPVFWIIHHFHALNDIFTHWIHFPQAQAPQASQAPQAPQAQAP